MSQTLPPAIGRPATRALAAVGIVQLDDLGTISEQELAELHGVGPKAIAVLKQSLDRSGLCLKAPQGVKPKKSDLVDGFVIKYHANGVTRWSKGKMVDGQPDGYWEWYRIDGTLKRSGHFVLGEVVGTWTTYDARGKVYKVTQK
ncbi:hypothetical protein IWX81_002491 [Salinibacterium sp. CAN_S4]|uniref:hypothetical protein n=1 Tax=Salinibacterium sp. CAN_S4 TaxID=2787727 RepID=UPI001A191E1F